MRALWKWWRKGADGAARATAPRTDTRAGTNPGREVRIGLDLGVANTRCVINVLGASPAEDECLAVALDGDSAVLPTTIAVDGDMLRIGSKAEGMDGAIRSVLMWLPMLAGEQVDTSCSGKYGNLRQTVFNLGDHMISAKEVAVLYLERVLGRVLKAVEGRIGDDRWHGTLRIALPAPAGEQYQAMLHQIATLALDMAMAAHGREPSMTDSLSGLTERYQRGRSSAPLEHCDIQIVPHARAVIAAVSIARPQSSGRRMLAMDLGAGSSSATVFALKGNRATLLGQHAVWYGMDDIDQLYASARAVRKQAPRVFRETSGMRSSDRPMICRGLDRMLTPMREALGKATKGGAEAQGWCAGRRADFDIVLLGGGGQFELLLDECRRRNRTPLPGFCDFWTIESLSFEAELDLLPCSGQVPRAPLQVADAERASLLLALGLADRSLTVAKPSRTRRPGLRARPGSVGVGGKGSETKASVEPTDEPETTSGEAQAAIDPNTSAQRARGASHDVH
jgi:hypothetical protein